VIFYHYPSANFPGECASVPYGSLTVEDYIQEGKSLALEDLPLNELLIELDHPKFVSPPNINTDSPVIVDIGLYIEGVEDLDVGENSYVLQGYLDLVWCDPRTKFTRRRSMSDPNRKQHMFLEDDAAKELEQIWWPEIFFANELHARETENQELVIDNDGTVEYREKFSVTLATTYDMHRFPFDRQALVAEIQSFAWNSDLLQFSVEEDLVGFSDDFEVPEYVLTGVEEILRNHREERDRYSFSELITVLHVRRVPTYYLTKVIIPLTLIVGISWAVFWMDPEALAGKLA
jgi:Neurotransmitter-gated ion-channel ligand binding domain